jgi:hypothetical protein
MIRRILYFLSLYILANPFLHAQNLTVEAHIDSTVIVIGGQTALTFEINQVPGKKVITPLFSDTIIGGIEIVEPLKADTTKADNGNILVKQRYVVTSFEDSLLYIPPYPFVLDGDTVWSKSLSLKVVQPFQIDTASNQIADIKTVMDPPFNWKALWRIILIIHLILLIGILIFILIRKLIQKKPIFESATPEPELPPHVLALAQLDRIRNEKAWQQNRTKQFHTDITDVLRVYIEKVYNVPCMEMTSEEIISNLHHLKFENKQVFNALMQILKLADLVKFAKWDAAPDEHELSLTNAYLFVNETMIDEEPVVVETEHAPTK